MAQTTRLRAIAAYLALLILTLPLLYALLWGGMALYVRISVERYLQIQYSRLPSEIASIETALALPDDAPDFQQFPDLSVAEQRTNLRVSLKRLQQKSEQPPKVHHSWLAAIGEAIWFPFASTSAGTIEPREWGEYPSPAELLFAFQMFALSGAGGFSMFDSDYWEVAENCAALMLLGMSFGVLFPAAFVLLPITRRRAKVRWVHIARVLLYSWFIPVFTIWLTTAVFVVSILFSVPPWNPGVVMPALCAASMLMYWLWWAIAIRRYLRLPHAWAVSGLLGVLVLLATPLVIVIIAEAMELVL